MRLNSYFSAFHTRISLDSTRVERIMSGHGSLRDVLSQDEEVKEVFVDSFLQGSYAIGTALRPKNDEEFDVDVVLAIDVQKQFGYLPDSDSVINWLVSRVTTYDKYKGKAKGKTKCVRIDYADGFHIDLLPAQCQGDPSKGVLVPPGWHFSNPIAYKAWCQSKNDSTGGKFTRIAKYLKWWRNCKLDQDTGLKSIILTTIVGNHMNEEFPSDGEALVRCMEAIARELKSQAAVPTIWNPSMPIGEENLARDWDEDDFKSFKSKFLKAAVTARAAYDEGNRDRSVKLWSEIFGDAFKESVAEGAKAMADSIRENRASITASLFLSNVRATRGDVQVKPVRQYGN